MKNNLWKKMGVVTPVLIAGTLLATSLPGLTSQAGPRDHQAEARTQTVVGTTAAKEQSIAATTRSMIQTRAAEGRLSEEDVRNIALSEVEGGRITEFERDDRNYYEVEITADGVEYELKIDATTGAIIKFEKDDLKKDAAKRSTTPAADPSAKKKISETEARRIALDRVGGGKVTEFEYDNGTYEVEIRFDGREYDLDIQAATGKITDYDVDETDDRKTANRTETKPATRTTTEKSRITETEARRIALDRVGGGKVTEIEYDDGTYEVEVRFDGREYDLDIQAATGKITDFEVDDHDDHDDHDDDDRASTKATSPGRISGEKARQIALARVGGGSVTDFELDDDKYEIEIEYKGREYEIEMNAFTGEINEMEIDD